MDQYDISCNRYEYQYICSSLIRSILSAKHIHKYHLKQFQKQEAGVVWVPLPNITKLSVENQSANNLLKGQ